MIKFGEFLKLLLKQVKRSMENLFLQKHFDTKVSFPFLSKNTFIYCGEIEKKIA